MKSPKSQRSNKPHKSHLKPSKSSINNKMLSENNLSKFSIQFSDLNSSNAKMNEGKTFLNPKFLNSMIRLIDKYNISYNILNNNIKNNIEPTIEHNDESLHEPKQNKNTSKTKKKKKKKK